MDVGRVMVAMMRDDGAGQRPEENGWGREEVEKKIWLEEYM